MTPNLRATVSSSFHSVPTHTDRHLSSTAIMPSFILPVYIWPIILAIFFVLARRPLLRLITPRALDGFPALPNPKAIVGDLGVLASGVKRHGGISLLVDELAQQLGPIFQLRVFNQKYVHLLIVSSGIVHRAVRTDDNAH